MVLFYKTKRKSVEEIKMDEIRVELALEIMQLKIVHYIKTYKGKDRNEFEAELKKLSKERERIYELDEDAIKKAYDVYLKEIKEGK